MISGGPEELKQDQFDDKSLISFNKFGLNKTGVLTDLEGTTKMVLDATAILDPLV